MTFLKKINISNIRKFGEGIEIPIQKGATIFLAPNGTGKTSIFEAIELGLTAGVQRLGLDGIGNLIRDEYSSSSVGLEFDNGIGGIVTLNKNESPKVTGNIEDIFGTIKPENIPFLLRITHLLDQQSNNWFVQSNSDLAGSLLQNLSIARDASKANQVITGAKKASTSKINKLEEERDNIKWRLDNWTMLLNNRAIEKEKQSGKLKPLEILAEEINKIRIETYKENILPLKIDIENINIELRILEHRFQNIISDNKFRDGELNLLIFSYNEFVDLEEIIKKDDIEIQNIESIMLDEKFRSNSIQDSLILKLKSITEIQETLDKIESEKKQYETLLSSKQEITKNNESLQQILIQINQNRLDSENLRIKIKEKEGILENQKSFESRTNELEGERENFKRLENLIAEWKRLLLLFDQYNLDLLNQKENENQLRLTLDKLKTEYNDKILIYRRFNQKFNDLNIASNAIQEAVSLIAVNISETENQCPVCLSEFNSNELNIKINEALNRISPALNNSKKELETVKNQVDNLNNLIQVEEANKNICEAKIAELGKKLDSIKIDIEMGILPNFDNAKDLETASIELSLKIENINNKFSELDRDAKKLGSTVTENDIRDLRLELYEFNMNNVELEAKNEILVERNNVLFHIVKSIEELNLQFSHEEDEQKLLTSKNSIETLNTEINSLRNRKAEIDEVVKNLTVRFEGLQNQSKIYSEKRSNLLLKWKNLGFAGDFDNKLLEEKINSNRDSIIKNEQNILKLQEIGIDLAGWAAHEGFIRIEKEISELCGGLSEEEYSKSINENYSKILVELTNILEKNAILNIFSTNLSTEIDAVNEQILSINPFWKKLLNRTVVDPRFAETTLNSYSRYKKPLAEVQVQLHGNKVLASHVASEAQLTDLQLTFLLSMAYKYQWSEWKGLLLDDPTQHHDLVHAAGVFDLLRDYIYDHGFQVLLTTHDPVHAKFFKRKLENDGIPVNILNLKPTKNGVMVFPDVHNNYN